jgi:hypothetical protein
VPSEVASPAAALAPAGPTTPRLPGHGCKAVGARTRSTLFPTPVTERPSPLSPTGTPRPEPEDHVPRPWHVRPSPSPPSPTPARRSAPIVFPREGAALPGPARRPHHGHAFRVTRSFKPAAVARTSDQSGRDREGKSPI